jgi:hypothetical protein
LFSSAADTFANTFAAAMASGTAPCRPKRLLGLAERRRLGRHAVSAVVDHQEWFQVPQVITPGDGLLQLTVNMHPDDPINTAASVAATAPAFSIRRLVLFAFIGSFIGVPFLLVF